MKWGLKMSKSSNVSMITGDPKKAIIKLAIPMMFSMLLIMLYNIADSIWVAGLGADALAAIELDPDAVPETKAILFTPEANVPFTPWANEFTPPAVASPPE